MSSRGAVAVLLGLLTGLVLGQLLTPSLSVTPSSSALERSTEEATIAYYEAVNRYLEDGDSTALVGMLDANFVDHSTIAQDQDAAGLVRYLAAMRAAYPDMRIAVRGMTPHHDMIAVAVATSPGTAAVPGGIAPDLTASPPGYEQLRVLNGSIAERWASQSLPPQFESITTIDLSFRRGWFLQCAVEQLTLAPKEVGTRRSSSHTLVVANSGTLRLEIEPRDADDEPVLLLGGGVTRHEPLKRGVLIDLDSESMVQFPEGEAIRVWNDGESEATAIFIELQYRSPVQTFYDGQSTRTETVIADADSEPSALLPLGIDANRTFAFSLIRVVAVPDAILPLHSVSGIEQVLVTEGTIEVIPQTGVVAVFGRNGSEPIPPAIDADAAPTVARDRLEVISPGDRDALIAGEGSVASSNALISYRVTGDAPAILWFFVLTSAASPGE